jgi:hypothetical protein
METDDYDRHLVAKINAQNEKILRLNANKGVFNEKWQVGGKKLTGKVNEIGCDYSVKVPQSYIVPQRQKIINANFNLRNMQQICCNFNPEDAVPDIED